MWQYVLSLLVLYWNKFKSVFQVNKTVIGVFCTQEEFQIYETLSKAKGFESVGDWAKSAIRNYVPPEKWKLLSQVPEVKKKSLDAAFEELDALEADIVMGPGVRPSIPNESEVIAVDPRIRVKVPLQPKKLHPCPYILEGRFPAPHTSRSCFGTCTVAPFRGQPCFVGAHDVRACPRIGANKFNA